MVLQAQKEESLAVDLEFKDLRMVGWAFKRPSSASLSSGFFYFPPSVLSKDVPGNTTAGVDYFLTTPECVTYAKSFL